MSFPNNTLVSRSVKSSVYQTKGVETNYKWIIDTFNSGEPKKRGCEHTTTVPPQVTGQTTSWSPALTTSRVSSLGSDGRSSPPLPEPSGSSVGPGTLCMWPRRPPLEHTLRRCWEEEWNMLMRANYVFCFILSKNTTRRAARLVTVWSLKSNVWQTSWLSKV